MTVFIRPVRHDDLALLKRLRLASLADAPGAFAATLAEEEAMPEAEWQARLDSNVAGVKTAGFFALVDGQPRGLVVGVRREDRRDSVNLNAMWVAPEARGRGAGRALVEAVCAWASDVGCARVTLAVEEDNVRAISLYRACGFQEAGRRPRDGDSGLVDVSMARRVSVASSDHRA